MEIFGSSARVGDDIAILSLVGCSQQDEKETAKDDKKVFTFSWSGDNGDVV
ncbi:hypothetical protein MHH81_11200 [Psychrobacillus sp. FSL H8-0484]|uniref:hypothetical protein n=1 Tax=Psychrobacillus sp. FSL H8-0484 TaxID=2921390 RepID=UPI0030FA6B2D